MAPPTCNNHPEEAATFVGTFMQTGDSVALCDECLVMFSAAMLHQMTGVDPSPFLAAISDDPEAEAEAHPGVNDPAVPEDSGRAEPPKPAGKRGRTSVASREAGTATDPNAPPVTISDGQGAAAA